MKRPLWRRGALQPTHAAQRSDCRSVKRPRWRQGVLQPTHALTHASERSHCASMVQQKSSVLVPRSVSSHGEGARVDLSTGCQAALQAAQCLAVVAARPSKPLAIVFPSPAVAHTCGAGRCIGQIVGTEFAKCLVGLATAMLASMSSSVAKQTIAGQSIFACAALHVGWCFLHGDGSVLNEPTGCMPSPQVVALSEARPTRSNWDAKVEIAQQRALLFLRTAALGVCRSDFDQQFKVAHARLLMSVF